MRYQFVYTFIAFCLILLACNKAPIGVNTYDVDYSKSATFDQNKKLTFVDVLSDSRCPINVDCIWAGEAEIALRATCSPSDTVNFVLRFGDGYNDHRDTIIFDIYKVEILEVKPLTEDGVEIQKEDYSLRVLIEKS